MSGLDMSGPEAIAKALALTQRARSCSLAEIAEIWEESGTKAAGLSIVQMLNALEGEGCTVDLANGICSCPKAGMHRGFAHSLALMA